MPLDPSIALGYKQPDFGDPINNLSQMLQLRGAQQSNQLNQMKMDEYGRGVDRTNKLQSILAGEYAKPENLQTAMVKGGFLKEANDYAKGNSDIAKTAAETKVKELEAANKRVDLAGSVFGFVRQNPTAENAFAALDHLASNGIYTPEQVNEYKAKIQASPQAVAQMADMAFRGALSAKDQLAKMGDFNAGATQQFTSTDPVTGKVTPTGSVAITESANNVANNKRIATEGALNRGVQREGQDLTRQRLEFDKTKPVAPKASGPMSVTLQKELLESDDAVQSGKAIVSTLQNALKINKEAYSGYAAKGRAVLASNLVPWQTQGADKTIDLDNMMTGQALESLKTVFGGMPTEGERKILLDMQASADKTPTQREAIITRAIAAAQRRAAYAGQKAKAIRSGEYLSGGIQNSDAVDPVDSLLDKYK